jgi:redox-sensitive bicupin YhaK (pirin superfamily)
MIKQTKTLEEPRSGVGELKTVATVYRPQSVHMVGDGFHVRNLFPSNNLAERIDPFLLLDYAGPTVYDPTDRPRGVGEHPHRGFETVTIVYQGEVEHRDSAGNAGRIGQDDVQWMTAAAGIVHEEKHEREFARRGGTLEAIQLWVNLPRAVKMSPPAYQTLLKKDIPLVPLENGAGYARVIAGEFRGVTGPARTYTPVRLYDVRLTGGGATQVTLPSGDNAAVFVLKGQVVLNGTSPVKEAELALFQRSGQRIDIQAIEDATLLIMSGEPIQEPVAWSGPFVMNTQLELVQAMKDYQTGKMGHLD